MLNVYKKINLILYMDKKIIKYKLKKNILEEKIIDMLNLKKEYYENEIINSNDNKIITNGVENFFYNLKSNQQAQMVIIVFGTYSVGKTTFISHLENYIGLVSKNLINITSNVIQKFIISSNNIDFLKDVDLDLKITIIECDINNVNLINLLLEKANIININIISKNTSTLKNKIINKIIIDISNKSDNFIEFIRNNNIIEKEEINNLVCGINLLKKKNKILTDDDFIFLDLTINSYYSNIIDLSNNMNLPSNTQKYYL